MRAPEEIEHWHFIVAANEKEKALLRILRYEDPDSALVFCNTRDDVRFVTRFLQRNEIDADMIQGEMTQAAREAVMKRIKAGELRVLVATDVAARGIDISDLSHVISYTSPVTPEVYTHRTGRTGRAGKSGTAISLVSGLDIGNFRSLQKVNRIVIPERKLPTEAEVARRDAERLERRDRAPPARHPRRPTAPAREETHLADGRVAVRRRPQGRRLLSAVLYEYLEHRHVSTPVRDEKPGARPRARPRPTTARRTTKPPATKRAATSRRAARDRRRSRGPSVRAGAVRRAAAAESAARASVAPRARARRVILLGVALAACAMLPAARPHARDRARARGPARRRLRVRRRRAPAPRPVTVCDGLTCADLVVIEPSAARSGSRTARSRAPRSCARRCSRSGRATRRRAAATCATSRARRCWS